MILSRTDLISVSLFFLLTSFPDSTQGIRQSSAASQSQNGPSSSSPQIFSCISKEKKLFFGSPHGRETLFIPRRPTKHFLCFIGSAQILCPVLSQLLGYRGEIHRSFKPIHFTLIFGGEVNFIRPYHVIKNGPSKAKFGFCYQER